MSARSIVLALLALATPAWAAQSYAPRWIVDAREREVGEPLDAALHVPLAAGQRLEVDPSALEADPSWVLASALRRGAAPAEGEWPAGALLSWSVASLEPGERALPAPALTLVDGAGKRTPLSVSAASARITALLREGEDEPRAPLGFRPLEGEAQRAGSPWLWAALAAAASGFGVWLVLRKRRRPAPAGPPSTFERLAALEARPVESPQLTRELYYELTALVREHVDRRLGGSRAAATDSEWLAALAGRAPAPSLEELALLLREAEPVKYAGHHPTHWAVRESLERARRALSGFEPPQRAA